MSSKRVWTQKNEYIEVDYDANSVVALGFLEKSVDGEWVVYLYDEHMRHTFIDKVKNKNTAKSLVRKHYDGP